MAKIADSQGRLDENSGYIRLFGNQQLGRLISKVQAAVIRTGKELEQIVEQETPANRKITLDTILLYHGDVFSSDIQVVFQPRMPKETDQPGVKVDIAIFDHPKRRVLVVELKDGDTFDTKKSSGELDSMTKFAKWLSQRTGYEATLYFCSFNQNDKLLIVRGAKGRFGIEHAMTGHELCAILGIDYDGLRKKRQSEQPENLKYFLTELLKISEIRQIITELLGSKK